MRQWFLFTGISLLACAPLQAGSASANLMVSVTVMDQCFIHSESRSASCAGGAAYALGVGRERIALPRDQLTASNEHAHRVSDVAASGTSSSLAGQMDAIRDTVLAAGGSGNLADAAGPIEAIRVTYSF